MMTDFIKTGVIGHPIAHSKSPLIHNHWIKKYGLQGKYEAIDIAPGDLRSSLKELFAQGYKGFNLTIPHKTKIIPLCDEIDETAKAVGAVNTIVFKEGKIFGTNTDVFGFVENIRSNAKDFDFTAGPAVVLGAGGAARAVLQGLIEQGVSEIRLLNRTRDKAGKLAQDFKFIEVFDWSQRSGVLNEANLLVNTTALGLTGQPALEINLSKLPKTALVNDVVYAPLHTGLLEKAKANGNPFVTGIGMLLHQARPAFEHWYGVMPDVDTDLEKKVMA
jgi:shikimate dehydrogenase